MAEDQKADDGTKPTVIEQVPGLQSVLADVTRALQESTAASHEATAASKDVGRKVDDLRRDFEDVATRVQSLESHVFGSNPPKGPLAAGAFPLDEVATDAKLLAVAADGKANTVAERFDRIEAELKKQSTWMGIGRQWFEFLGTPSGRQKALGVLATVAAVAAALGVHFHNDASAPPPPAQQQPIVVVVSAPTASPSPSTSGSSLPPPAVSR